MATSIFARVTDGNRLARGTCRLSKFSSQNPEMSGLVPVPCAARPIIVDDADRMLLFSSDYPHWDFDDPRFAFRTPLSEIERQKIFSSNARAVYKL